MSNEQLILEYLKKIDNKVDELKVDMATTVEKTSRNEEDIQKLEEKVEKVQSKTYKIMGAVSGFLGLVIMLVKFLG